MDSSSCSFNKTSRNKSDVEGSVLIVTGEASGDIHASEVVRCLMSIAPNISVFGMGGKYLRAAGCEVIVPIESVGGVMGLTEVVSSIGKILKAFYQLLNEAKKRKPKLAILVDFPDFNLRLAKQLSKNGIKVLYFISPQLWAWRKGRINQVKQFVRKVVPIFPFEEAFYHENGVDAEYVGHPFIDREPIAISEKEFLSKLGMCTSSPILALLPGSRNSEVLSLLAPMLEAFDIILSAHPMWQALIPVAPTLKPELVRNIVGNRTNVYLVDGQAKEVLQFSDVAVVSSGTATVEAALAEIPFVVVYKLSSLTFFVGKMLVRGVKFIAMPNLIAGHKIVEELLQNDVTPERIAQEVENLIEDSSIAQEMKKNLRVVRQRLTKDNGAAGVSMRVANIILELINE